MYKNIKLLIFTHMNLPQKCLLTDSILGRTEMLVLQVSGIAYTFE